MTDKTEWVMVPREPTPEMLTVGCEDRSLPGSRPATVYRAMLAAAPTPPAQEAQPMAWCQLNQGRQSIAYFEGKPMVMPGPVGNDVHPDPLYALPPDAARRIAELEAERDDKQAEIDRLQEAPWPEWADKIFKIVRDHTGYDGFDDQTNGVDLPEEVDEALSHYSVEVKKLEAERDRLREALEHLVERADVSDDVRYGTLGTSFVRDIALAALGRES